MAAFLCDAKADVNLKDYIGRTPMHIAAQYNLPHVLQLLQKHGSDINAKDVDGNTPLHYGKYLSDVADKLSLFFLIASRSGSIEATKYLCENNAILSEQNNEMQIPIEIGN
jgi:ankyrin repeat protein